MIEIFHFLKFQEFINELGKSSSIGNDGMNPLGMCCLMKVKIVAHVNI